MIRCGNYAIIVLTPNAEFVLDALCKLSCNWYGTYVFPTSVIAGKARLSVYATRKALRELRAVGLVENGCMGRPAIVACASDGVEELQEDARTPIRGFQLTGKGMEHERYRKALKEWDDRIRAHFEKMCEEVDEQNEKD